MQAGVQGVQDIQDGDERRRGSNGFDGDAPGKSRCDNFHDLHRRVCSGHRKAGVRDAKPVRVRWEGDVKTSTLGAGKKIMKRRWGKGWGCRDKMRAGVVGNNWVLLHRRKRVWGHWSTGGRRSERPGAGCQGCLRIGWRRGVGDGGQRGRKRGPGRYQEPDLLLGLGLGLLDGGRDGFSLSGHCKWDG